MDGRSRAPAARAHDRRAGRGGNQRLAVGARPTRVFMAFVDDGLGIGNVMYGRHAAMRDADVILNNSHSEGLANSLLEAITLGVPVLARNIPGNAAVIEHGKNGLLYDNEKDFVRSALQLFDRGSRQQLSHPEVDLYNPAKEAAELYGLVGHWKLDEGSGTVAADSTPFGNDGTLQAEADAEERDSPLARIANCLDLAFDSSFPKTARNKDAVVASQ